MLVHYSIRAYTMLGVGYVTVRFILWRCSAWLRKPGSKWTIIQDKYKQGQYKGENQECVYWTILGSDKNWLIIHCIELFFYE